MPTALDALRNVAFVGHPSSGKTTLVDALAFATGASPRKGSVADKTSICDTEPEEQDKGHTLQMAVVQVEKDGHVYTFLDTPGYPDFISETNAAIQASDLVVGVLSAAGPATFNLRKKLETATQAGRGRMIVVTHVDSENVDYERTVEELREKVGDVCVPVSFPDHNGSAFSSVETIFKADFGDWKRRLMDRVMDACEDEELVMNYLDTGELTEEQLRAHMPNAIAKGALVPVLACNPLGDVGVNKVLSFLQHFGPTPAHYEQLDSEGNAIPLDPEGALLGKVFAVRSDPHVGKICMARILRGSLGPTDSVLGPRSDGKPEKLGGLFRMVGKKRENCDGAKPGEIVGFSKVEHVRCGESFAHQAGDLVRVPSVPQPDPMVALAVVPKSRADEQKIGEALHKLESEDPTFTVEVDKNTHELVMHGMSELHLQVMEHRLKRRYGVEIETHLPRIHYKETITKKADGHFRHKKQSGGRGQFAECYIRLAPLAKGSGVQFKDSVVGGSIPRNLIPAVEKGMRELASQGILTHSEVIDVEYELYDGKFHDVDSDEASFKVAGKRAMIDAFKKANPVLMEPVMELEIHVPTECAGTIFSDLTSQRRGHVLDQWTEQDGAITVIKATAPLATTQTYQRDLKSQTSGEGTYTQRFHDFAAVPAQEQQRVLAQLAKEHEDD